MKRALGISVVLALGCGLGPGTPPAGPAVQQRLQLPDEPVQVLLFEDGTTVFRFEDRLIGATPGKVAWERVERWDPWAERRGEGLLVSLGEQVMALDPKTGKATETWAFPKPKQSEDTDAYLFDDPVRVQAATQTKEGWVLVDGEAQFWRLKPESKPKKAFEKLFQIPEEDLYETRLLHDPTNGTFILEEYGAVRRFKADGTQVFAAFSHDSVGVDGTQLLADGAVLTVIDKDLMVLEPSCAGTFAPSGWPHPGEMTYKGQDEVPKLRKAPRGCVRSSIYLDDIDPVAPLVVGDRVVANAEYTAAYAKGSKVWTSSVYGSGTPVLGPDGSVLVIGVQSEGESWQVFALDPGTGTVRWASPLQQEVPFVFSVDELYLETRGRWVLAGYEKDMSWMKLP